MSYNLIIKDSLNIHEDVVRIVRFFNKKSTDLGSDFVIAFDDTLARLEFRFAKEVQVRFAPKFGDIYGEPIIAEKGSPSTAKKFKDYYVYYLLNDEMHEAVILAVEYGPRDPEYLRKLLGDRRK